MRSGGRPVRSCRHRMNEAPQYCIIRKKVETTGNPVKPAWSVLDTMPFIHVCVWPVLLTATIVSSCQRHLTLLSL